MELLRAIVSVMMIHVRVIFTMMHHWSSVQVYNIAMVCSRVLTMLLQYALWVVHCALAL